MSKRIRADPSREWLVERTRSALAIQKQEAKDSYQNQKRCKKAYEDAKKERYLRGVANRTMMYAQPLDWCMQLGTPWRASTKQSPAPVQYHVNQVLTAFALGWQWLRNNEEPDRMDLDPELVEDTFKQIRVYNTKTRFGPLDFTDNGQHKGDERDGYSPVTGHNFEGKCEFVLSDEIIRGFNVGNDMYITSSIGCRGSTGYSGMALISSENYRAYYGWKFVVKYHGLGSILVTAPRPALCAALPATTAEFVAFTGLWKHDSAVSGVVTFICGSTYTGTWQDGKSDGSGVYSHSCRHCLDVSRLETSKYAQHKAKF